MISRFQFKEMNLILYQNTVFEISCLSVEEFLVLLLLIVCN